MVRKIYLSFTLLIILISSAFSQSGSGTLKGVIKDSKSGETIPFANVIVELGGIQIGTGQSNFNGEYQIKPINPGSYNVKCSYVGYKPVKITGVIISSGKITNVDIKLDASVVEMKEFEVVEYDVPLIEDYQGKTVTKEEIYALPTRNINSVAATTAGVTQQDEGDGINVRGSRGDATFYFVDGIKVRGSTNIPQQGIEQIQIITGGLPAMYGDATGGIISITTRGPSQAFHGGVEGVRSVDGYGYNLVGLNLTGPIATKKNAEGQKIPFIGFFFSSELSAVADADPSAVGITTLKKDKLAELQLNPLRPGPLGVGKVPNAAYVRASDFEVVKRRENAQANRASFAGKIDFKVNKSINLTLGGTFDFGDSRGFNYGNSMFNPEESGRGQSTTSRGYVKFTQRFSKDDEEKSASIIKNVFYTLQADYTRNTGKSFNDRHKDNIFDYGYVGKFKTYKAPVYRFGLDSIINGSDTILFTGLKLTAYADTLFSFTPSNLNPLTANYTSQFYDYAGDLKFGNYQNFTQVQQGGGLLNGALPQNVYSLYSNTGTTYGGWGKSLAEQIRFVGNASADIKGHEIGTGFEYEQRFDRGYSVAPIGLWGLMRQLANRHIEQFDLKNPLPVYNSAGEYTDTINYNRLYDPTIQSFFDRNLRSKLGKPVNGLEWLDIDNLDPSTFSLNFFSPDELLNNGNALVSYYGYDAYGNILRGKRSIDDYVNAKDEFGNFKREVGAFNPIYNALYIQDKFAFKDLIFNVGLRVDRYDANQKVLKDQYSLYETRKAGEFQYSSNNTRPSSIEDDFVVYVKDQKNTNLSDIENIAGYRNGNRWYNSKGVEILDPAVIAQSTNTGRATPALVNPGNQTLSSSAFVDYKPQINVMPRIAFQFPISDVAQFFAHYDVLTQRPTEGIRFDPINYYFLSKSISSLMANPNLKPQRTIDYEVGFKQVLTKSSAITISTFYRELRNLITVIPINYSYPVNYQTFGNIDFGTVKGISVAYDLRRTGNVRMTANYTLQFADGTGTSAGTGAFLINSGQPNLRTTLPLGFDVRHQIQTTFDYRYDEGKRYNGPILFGKKIFENAGFNMIMIANSGTPYSRSSYYTQDAGAGGRSILKGSPNGSRLPFQYRINVRIDKTFTFNYGKSEGDERKSCDLQVYVLIQNLLNFKNIINVYRATGNPDSDGYLTAATSQAIIQSQLDPISFADLYSAKVRSPYNYSRPRVIRVGAILNF